MGGGCVCEACGKRFKSVRTFDDHRTGDYERRLPPVGSRAGKVYQKNTRRCLTDGEMRAIGLHLNETTGCWHHEMKEGAREAWVTRAAKRVTNNQSSSVARDAPGTPE